ncbi:MAG: hypothetical protein IPI49_22985 [Myxococcales bacterium]|nr:hypothetical protein [Myxococcales bacterium]
MWIMYGALAALLVLLAPALWRSVLVARRRATLFRLGTFLGDTHDDGEAMAWGRDLGVHASLRYQEASLSRNSALGAWFPFRRTEISAELGASYPLVVDVVRRRWPWSERAPASASASDSASASASAWNPRWDALVAPAEVVERLIHAEAQAELLRLGATELRLVEDVVPRFTFVIKGWLLDFERAQQALRLAASLASGVEAAFAAAEAAAQAALRNEEQGAAYRGDPASPAQRRTERRTTELASAQQTLARRKRRRQWATALTAGALVGAAVGLTLTLLTWWITAAGVVATLMFLAMS